MKLANKIVVAGGVVAVLFAALVFWTLIRFERSLYAEKEAKLRELVESAKATVQRYAVMEADGRLDRATAQEQAKDVIRAITFGEDGYFFLTDYDNISLVHPSLAGKSMDGLVDENGTYFGRELLAMARDHNAGLVRYVFPHKGETKPVPKFTYVSAIPEWQWYVATGTYVDDVQAQVNAMRLIVIIVTVLLNIMVFLGLRSFAHRFVAGILEVSAAAKQLAQGDVAQTVQYQAKDETGELADSFRETIAYLQEVAAGAEAVSRGDLSVELRPRSERDVVTRNFREAIGVLRALLAETNALTAAASAGQLEQRADATRFAGGYGQLVQGINATIEAMAAPLRDIADTLERLAQRDLTARVTATYQGDFETARQSCNTAAAALEQALSEVAAGAEQVSVGSNEITQGAQSLASSAGEQASSLEEVSSSLQELSSMSRHTATSAQEARSQAQSAETAVQGGVTNVGRLAEAMARIKSASDATSKIVKTIDEIAFQTNLLALNAAVEAARAGDAGKGFAVVAEEVRSLAMRSAQAAKNTAELIEQAVRSADEGVTLNGEALRALEVIQERVTKVGAVLAEIAAASEQQNEGVGQINAAVEQMNDVTQQVAAASEESASTAEELRSQAQMLSGLVSQFVVGNRAATSVPRPAPAPAPSAAARAAKPAPVKPKRPSARPGAHGNGHANGHDNGVSAGASLIPFGDDSVLGEF